MRELIEKRHRSPAVCRLITDITAQIRAGAVRPGAYLPGAHELAATYGISYVSVINALKTLREAGLIDTVRGRGAFVRQETPAVPVASPAKTGLSEITVVFARQYLLSEGINPDTEWLYRDLLMGLTAGMMPHDIRLHLLFADVVGDQWQEVLDRLPADAGVFFIYTAPPAWVLYLLRRGTPFALLQPREERDWEGQIPCAFVDYFQGVHDAVAALIAKGFRRVAHLGAPGLEHEGPRYNGYIKALEDSGLEESTLISCPGITRTEGRQAMEAYLDAHPTPEFDLLVAENDMRALGAIEALATRGLRVPEDVAVLGFDDHPLAAQHGLTTIRQPMRELGEQVIPWFLEQVISQPTTSTAQLAQPCFTVWRHSTAR